MSEPILEIITVRGERYLIHAEGRIQRTDMVFGPSDSWRLLGLRHVKRREFVSFGDLARGAIPAPLTYKNGVAQWRIRDFDHGSVREWGNRGPAFIRLLARKGGANDCGHEPSPHADFTTGYGIDAQGKKHCYACCAENDRKAMIETGRATLYLTDKGVTNWPGSLRFNVGGAIREGRHNIAGKRYDVWFTGPDGKDWHGVTYGDNTQICHCKRIKA